MQASRRRDGSAIAKRCQRLARAFDPIWGIRFTAPGAAAEVDWVNRSRDRRISLAEWWAEVSGASPEHHALAGLKRPERGK